MMVPRNWRLPSKWSEMAGPNSPCLGCSKCGVQNPHEFATATQAKVKSTDLYDAFTGLNTLQSPVKRVSSIQEPFLEVMYPPNLCFPY